MATLSKVALVLASIFVCSLLCNVEVIGSRAQAKVQGGQISGGGGVTVPTQQWCQQTNTTCPDPGGLQTTCTLNPTTQTCWRCNMNVPNWTNCAMKQLTGTYTCTQTIDAKSPYCATSYYQNPVDGSCPACSNKWSDCGSQIPSVTGVPCP